MEVRRSATGQHRSSTHVSAKMELKSCGEEAQRLIAEIAVETPLVVLHGCTTLLQRLTSLADPSASRWVQSSERYLAAVVSAMLTLHKWRCDVVHDVLRSTLMGVARVVANAASTYVGSSAPRRCTIGIHEHTPVLLSEWLQNPQEQRRVLRGGVEDGTSSSSSSTSATMSQSELQQLLFCGEMVCETTTELVRAAFGVCHIVREVAHDRLHHFLSAEERHALLQLAAFILAVRLDEPSRDEHQHDDGGRRRRLEPTSSSLIMGTNQRLHRTAGALVELARGEGWLLPDVHGPMMLYTLVMRLSAHASVEDVEAWEGSLLMWLVRSIRDGVVQPSAWRDVLERMHGLVLMLMCVQRWRTAAANTSTSASWMLKKGAHHHQLVNQLMLLWRCCAGLLTEGECRCQAQVLLVQLLGASPREHVLAYFSTPTPFTWWLDDVLLGNSSSSSSSSFHQHNWHALIAALPEEVAHQLVGAAYTHMMEMKLDEYERAWLLANMFVCLEQQAASSRGGTECNHTPPTATSATATATSSSPSSLEHVRVEVRGVVELALRDGVSEARFATCVQILVLLHANNTSRHVGEWWSHMEHFLRVVPVEKFWTCPNVTCQLMYHVMVDDAPDAVVQHLLRLVPPLTTSSPSSSSSSSSVRMMRTASNLLAGLGRGLTERLRALMKGVPLSWIASPATTATSCARMAADPPHALMAVLHVLEHHLQWMKDVRSFLLTILPARTMDVGDDDDDEWCSAVGLVVESYQRALLLLHVLCVPFSPTGAPMREENEVVEVESNEDSVDVLELSNDPSAMPRDLFSARLEKLVMELRGHAHHLLLVLHPLYVELRGDANHTCIHALRDAIFQAIALSAVLQQQHHQQQQQHVAVVEILFEHMDAWTHAPALLGHGCLALTWMLQHQRLTSGVVSRLIHVHDQQQQQQEHDESASEHLIISALSMLTTLFGMGWGKLLTSCEDDAYVEAITMRHVARMVEHNPSPWIREGQHLLEFGCRVWERNTTSPALRAALVEATHAMLQHTLRWSAEDCYRGYAYMACNSFFSAVLASLSAPLRERGVAMCAIDAVVGPRLIDSSQQAQEEVEMLVASHAAPGADRVALLFPPALAYVLHHCATEKPAERVRVLKHMAGRVGISMEKIPSLTHQWLIPIVVYIISMEADARLRQSMEMVLSTQQHAGAATPSTLWRLREATNTDTLQVALQHVVSLAECPSTPRGVARALELPVPLSVATHELSKSLLKLLDEVDLRMGLRRHSGATNATTSAAPSSSSATTTAMMCSSWSRRRWLLGLAAMIRVLGHEAMLMEAKLAATLDILSTDPSLVEAVCLVQYELIHGAPSEHLVEHAAAMVANFVSLEQHGRLCAASLHLSQRALHLLHTKTPTSVVWQSFVQVLCARSALMADLGRELGSTGNVAVANQALLLDGFIRVMDTSSIKCRAIFAQGLYEHLRAADRSSREAFSAAAAERGDVLPALLRCVREVSDEDAQYALKCLGLLGAMVPQPQITEKATHNNNNTHGSSSSSSSSPPSPSSSSSSLTQSRGLQVESVLHWRVLAATLLGEFCYRAMSNTTDAGIHDRTGYAVQELIRACCQAERVANCGPPLREEELVHVEELQRYSWWSAVPPSAQRLLTPFLTTKLVLHIYSEKERRSPNYTTGMPFQTWLVGFFSTLTAHCRSTFVEMIVPFHNLAKRSSGVMEFLLPYVMVHLIEGGEHKAWEAMLVEMEAIFSSVKEVPSGGAATTSTATTATTMQQHEDDLSSHRRISTQEHIHLLLHVVEDLAHLRWLLLRVGHRIDRKPELQDADVQACVLLAAKVESFLHRLPWSKRALAAEAVGSHMVALRCVEASNGLPVQVDELKRLPMQALFAALNDRDSARSLHRSRPSATPEEAAFSCEHNGDWQSALQHSELALQRRPDSFPHQVIALRCMRQLCQLQLMLRYGNALLTEMQDGRRRRHTSTTCSEVAVPHRMEVIQNFANDAAWRLGEWSMMMKVGEEVNVEVAPPSLATPVFRLVQQLDEGGSKNRLVQRAVEEECRKLTASIRAASTEGYSMQVYPHVALLHGLMDVVYVDELMTGQREMPKSGLRTIIREHLSTRLHLTDATLDSREPLLALHRTIYGTLGMQEEVAHTWMEQAELLRRSGFNEPALGAARRALLDGGGTSMNASLYAMMMELLVEVHSPLQAIEFAEEQIRHNADLCPAISAFLQVSITKLRVEIGSQTPAEVLASYSTALHLHESERVHHHIALFYDHLFTLRCPNPPHLGGEGSEVAMSELLSSTESLCLLAMDHFGRSLRLGSSRVWVSLPRMLTLWLDTTLRLSHISDAHRSHARARVVLDKLNQLMKSFLVGPTAIAPQILITALSQLLSRLIHPCSAIITHAITHLMTIFPQQCLWLVLPICFSKQENRAKCAKNEVLRRFADTNTANAHILSNAFDIFSCLSAICNAPASTFTNNNNNVSLRQQPYVTVLEPKLPQANFILPTMANLSPNIHAATQAEVFPTGPTFHHFDDRVEVMSSMQKPKRIWIVSNEGHTVPFLCKSKDEPRKDIRMMEIASLINTLFLTDAEARRRHFSLRRYSIAALNDDCAVIEWVHDVSPLRAVVYQHSGLMSTGVRVSQVRAWHAKVESKVLTKMKLFTDHILPAAPPILHFWFDSQFRSVESWYEARKLFTQSTALWSIAGHIVGLGDRHSENLMLDTVRGEMMHVDFACMFDKGELLEVPEVVRFRLTPNMVDGMGIAGTDGPFRAACEIALRCQMMHRTAVMSVVETLLHDPLVEWSSRNSKKSVDPKPLFDRVARRLNGYLDLYSAGHEKDTLALNVESQVAKLISHASALENLSEMYIWWMAWV